jgi:hypothetical protein
MMKKIDNLPTWPGAAAAYSLAYKITGNMARSRRHVTVRYNWLGKPCGSSPSDELKDYIDALNKGDEERIKGLNLLWTAYGFNDEAKAHGH